MYFYRVALNDMCATGTKIPEILNILDYRQLFSESMLEIIEKFRGKPLSPHGINYFVDCNTKSLSTMWIELYFEKTRVNFFKNRLSRFQSLFACVSLEDAIRFWETYRSHMASAEEMKIYEIECKSYFRADMNALGGESFNDLPNQAAAYWSGNPWRLGKEKWECLLDPRDTKIMGVYRIPDLRIAGLIRRE